MLPDVNCLENDYFFPLPSSDVLLDNVQQQSVSWWIQSSVILKFPYFDFARLQYHSRTLVYNYDCFRCKNVSRCHCTPVSLIVRAFGGQGNFPFSCFHKSLCLVSRRGRRVFLRHSGFSIFFLLSSLFFFYSRHLQSDEGGLMACVSYFLFPTQLFFYIFLRSRPQQSSMADCLYFYFFFRLRMGIDRYCLLPNPTNYHYHELGRLSDSTERNRKKRICP